MATLLDIGAGRVATVATFYKTSELLGSGRYSEVYKAFDTHHHSDVALKLYVGFDEKAHELARNEEAVLARLGSLNSEYFPKLRRGAKHRIHNRNHPLLVLELGTYVSSEGQKRILSLKRTIPQAGSAAAAADPDSSFWTAENLIRWFVHMTQALKQLHGSGIVHRDLKPGNILIKRGPGQSEAVPLFLDFNSAAGSGDSGSGTGTPRYLPPEVTLGKRREPCVQDDLWAIAMVGWEMIYGQGASPESSCRPNCLVTGVIPEAITGVLRRALSILPETRFY
jgi:serine/threonine protein kinase